MRQENHSSQSRIDTTTLLVLSGVAIILIDALTGNVMGYGVYQATQGNTAGLTNVAFGSGGLAGGAGGIVGAMTASSTAAAVLSGASAALGIAGGLSLMA